MNRNAQSVPKIVEHFKGKTGFIIWEFGIGRDNCRFAWDQNGGHPATAENAAPFHGMVYPDGHPWAVDDVKAFLGEEAFARTPLFSVVYFKDENFTEFAKRSVTPFVDFDLMDEPGNGSPDASVGIPKDHYSIRWAGTVASETSGKYVFHVDSDHIVRILVNDKPVVEKKTAGREVASGSMSLDKGTTYPVVIEYAHATGPSSLHVTWEGPGMAKTVLMSSTPPPGH
jgi:hypothetical protein